MARRDCGATSHRRAGCQALRRSADQRENQQRYNLNTRRLHLLAMITCGSVAHGDFFQKNLSKS
jgi:hypothetical protein